MYAAQLRQKPEFKHLKNPTYHINHYSKMQTHQLENLKRDLELKKARQQSTAMRNKLLQYRDKVNYQNELDRIRGYLSSYDNRFPIGTVKRLRDREYELKKLGAQIT
jgi:predicted RNase H-like nuclease